MTDDFALAAHSAFAQAAPEFFQALDGSLAQPGGAVPVKVFIDQGISQLGDYAEVVGSAFRITVLRQGGAAPAVGLVLTVGARSFRLERRIGESQDSTEWEAAHAG